MLNIVTNYDENQMVHSVNRILEGSFILDGSESDIASRWVQRKFHIMFKLSSDRDQRKKALA